MNSEKLAVVTGGASGIGKATATAFAVAGYRVVIADINAQSGSSLAAELTQQGLWAKFHELDLSSDHQVESFANTVLTDYGVPDVLINSGGLLQNATRVMDMDMAEFDRIWQVNVRGTVIASRAFGKPMCQAGRGSIVHLCSLTTYRPSAQVAYAMGKASLKMLTEIMAAELGPQGVRVNAVAPGYTLTPAMQARIDAGERDPAAIVDRSALRRFVQSEEVAQSILFLCSDAANAITGIVMPIDAGWLPTTGYQAFASQPK